MKKQTISTLAALALLTMGAHAQNPDTQMKAHIMHHSGSDIQMFDTLFSKSDDYSIEQFLRDKGFDPAETEIIRTEGTGEQGVWVMEAEGNWELTWNTSEDDGQGHQSVFIRKDCGNVSDSEKRYVKEIRQGEGTEDIHIDVVHLSEIDRNEFTEDIEGETTMSVKVVKVINDDGDEEKRVWINGEEVNPESAEGQEFFQEQTGKPHNVVVRHMDGEGDTAHHVQYKLILIKDHKAGLPEGTEIETIIESDENGVAEPFTIALLAEVPSFDDAPASTGEALNLRIENLQFFPNPNEGKFNLIFELPQSGETQIEIFNTSGQRVYSEDLGTFNGEFRRDIDISAQPAGTYILHITQAGKQLAEKVIVK